MIVLGVLLGHKEKTLSKKLISSIFFLFLIVILYTYGEINSIKIIYGFGFIFADSIGFLLGPLLYLYIRSIYLKPKLVLPQGLWHFLPAFIYIITISIPFLVSILGDEYLFSYIEFISKNIFLLQFQALYLIAYTIASILSLQGFRRFSKISFSNLSGKDLDWISYLLFGILLVLIIHLSNEAYSVVTNGHLSFDNSFTTISLVFVMFYLAYFGVYQSQVLLPEFIQNGLSRKPNINLFQVESTHHLSNATEEEISELKNKLYQVFEDQKPYLNEYLNLKTLAEMIPTSDRKLSALLNHHLNTNFYDFINHYRVEEVKRKMLLREFDNYTLLALALDAGFNSKASFNRIFKKETGFSPSAYKNKVRENQ